MSALSDMGETRAEERAPELTERDEPGGERSGKWAWSVGQYGSLLIPTD